MAGVKHNLRSCHEQLSSLGFLFSQRVLTFVTVTLPTDCELPPIPSAEIDFLQVLIPAASIL